MDEVAVMNYILEISKKLDELFSDQQVSKDAVIPSSIRVLCENIIIESLLFRKIEWFQREQVDVDTPAGIEEAIDFSVNSINYLLADINSIQSGEGESLNYITLNSFLEEINSKWCNIFPFC